MSELTERVASRVLGTGVEGLTVSVARRVALSDLPSMGDHRARFEEGKPADPTENMSPEDAEKWRKMNDKYEDKFGSSDRLGRANKPDKIRWENFSIYAGHRKYLKRVLEVLGAVNAGSIRYLKPGTDGYDWVKQKFGGKGRLINLPRMKGRVVTLGGRDLFIGRLAGEEIILKHSDFKKAQLDDVDPSFRGLSVGSDRLASSLESWMRFDRRTPPVGGLVRAAKTWNAEMTEDNPTFGRKGDSVVIRDKGSYLEFENTTKGTEAKQDKGFNPVMRVSKGDFDPEKGDSMFKMARVDPLEQLDRLSRTTKQLPVFFDSLWRNFKDHNYSREAVSRAKELQKLVDRLDVELGQLMILVFNEQ